MKKTRKIIIILIAVIIVFRMDSSVAEVINNEGGNWQPCLITNLKLYLSKKNRKEQIFQNIISAIRSNKPGENVFFCTNLLKKVSTYNTLEKKVESIIKILKAKKTKSIVDYIILSILMQHKFPENRSIDISEDILRYLDIIIKSDSSWKDWAYWEKYQYLALRASWPKPNSNFLTLFKENGKIKAYYTPRGDTTTDIAIIMSNAAIPFLQKHRNTYMKRDMIEQIIGGQYGNAYQAISKLKNVVIPFESRFNTKILPIPLLQQKKCVSETIKSIKTLYSSNIISQRIFREFTARIELYHYLIYISWDRKNVKQYLDVFENIK